MEGKLTIIILDFMKAKRVLKNVRLLYEQKVDFLFRVVVVDNSCNGENANTLKEGLKKYIESGLELKINKKNNGYIQAHNRVVKNSKGKFIAIINPDVLLEEKDSLQKMIGFMEKNPDVGILGPKQINDNGEMALSVRSFPKLYLQISRRTFLRYLPIIRKKVYYDEMKHLDCSKTQDVDWLQSSCVIIRQDLWEKLGGFIQSILN